ncbi:DNA mismatch repair protein MutT [Candidatus Nomurabacteria bacterium CG10_big_fil_rev_8_21_14_0_10_35_16]|uniref:Oxidized purine nucleoside triphosphate hydrolase n=1 Tax=Candidatus Nomurabacteria bacterium CG10_big_fil_rev_8_21_14_0_10_35_16 TaxID=1974731 RepID=A0A2H0TBE8_9BACT|nr:MAG: DNA mismatch repair protein MutT [Candidatus Nomurabacteria bacterium CG10_big_fil_rev_8_21_14_0_10_35_16]
MSRTVTTLCIIHQHPKILLGMKKRGFGAGRWNGFGGKITEGESIEESLVREIKEEAGIELSNFEKVGLLEFEFAKNGEIVEVHLFKTSNFNGEPEESEEMKPQWFHIDEIPFSEMWPDDLHWMPLFLRGEKFKGRFLFGEGDVILEQKLEVVEKI